jgi:hypothetical protein
MARASTWTLLSLDRYFQIIGMNPSHANSAATGTTMSVARNACQDVWTQWPWQNVGRVSREDLAEAIADAERDIAEALGWWPAPIWTTEEVQPYPRHYRPEVLGTDGVNNRGLYQPVRAKWGHVIAPGVRTVDGCQNVRIAYSDADGDGLNETATVTATDATWTDVREIKVYFENHNDEQVWEVRPARTKTLTAAGVFTATFWSWQLIDPDLWEALPQELEPEAIDWSDATNLEADADICREYNDTTEVSATFYWEPNPCNLPVPCSCGGTGCAACQLTTQDGCLHVRDAKGGLVVPQPGAYDSDEEAWASDCFTVCRDPDYVKLWYYSGLISDEYLRSTSMDPLGNWLAMSIAQIATARLQKPLCSCSNVTALADEWRQDLSITGPGGAMLSEAALDNPFGTRRGEVVAWKRISKLALRRGKVALI